MGNLILLRFEQVVGVAPVALPLPPLFYDALSIFLAAGVTLLIVALFEWLICLIKPVRVILNSVFPDGIFVPSGLLMFGATIFIFGVRLYMSPYSLEWADLASDKDFGILTLGGLVLISVLINLIDTSRGPFRRRFLSRRQSVEVLEPDAS
jgi:hypothetical protein